MWALPWVDWVAMQPSKLPMSVLMDDDPRKIALAVKIARRTIHIAHENVVFAIGVKVAVLILATIGLGTMWMAVFADVGVTVLVCIERHEKFG